AASSAAVTGPVGNPAPDHSLSWTAEKSGALAEASWLPAGGESNALRLQFLEGEIALPPAAVVAEGSAGAAGWELPQLCDSPVAREGDRSAHPSPATRHAGKEVGPHLRAGPLTFTSPASSTWISSLRTVPETCWVSWTLRLPTVTSSVTTGFLLT